MIQFARALPRLRRRVAKDLAREGCRASESLACAVRLLDRGFFRIGSEDYAEENDTYGIATMRKRHVTVDGRRGRRSTTRPRAASDGSRRSATPRWPRLVGALKQRRGGGEELLAYKRAGRWVDVKSADINEYVKEAAGDGVQRQGLPHLERHGARRRGARRVGAGRAAPELAQAGQDARGEGGGALPRQHPGGRARLLHRPARVRPLRRRPDDRRRAPRAGRGHGPPGPTSRARSRRACSTCSPRTASRTRSSDAEDLVKRARGVAA